MHSQCGNFSTKLIHFSCPSAFLAGGGTELSISFGKSLVENGNETVFEHDFKFVVLVVLSVKGFEQGFRVGLRGKKRQLIPTV